MNSWSWLVIRSSRARGRVDARDEVDDDDEVGRAVSQRAGDESEVLAALAIFLLLGQDG